MHLHGTFFSHLGSRVILVAQHVASSSSARHLFHAADHFETTTTATATLTSSTVTSPDTRLPQNTSQHHEPHAAQCEDQSGRLAINSALTGYEPNVASNLTALAHRSTNTISRRHSLRSQTSTDNALRSPCSRAAVAHQTLKVLLHCCNISDLKKATLVQVSITLKQQVHPLHREHGETRCVWSVENKLTKNESRQGWFERQTTRQ